MPVDERARQLEQQRAHPRGVLDDAVALEHAQASRAPAAAARSLVPNVEPWRTARSIPSNTRSNASRETSTPPIGTRPPESAFATQIRSGCKAPVLEREEPPGAADPGLHLVADEQRAGVATQPLHAAR